MGNLENVAVFGTLTVGGLFLASQIARSPGSQSGGSGGFDAPKSRGRAVGLPEGLPKKASKVASSELSGMGSSELSGQAQTEKPIVFNINVEAEKFPKSFIPDSVTTTTKPPVTKKEDKINIFTNLDEPVSILNLETGGVTLTTGRQIIIDQFSDLTPTLDLTSEPVFRDYRQGASGVPLTPSKKQFRVSPTRKIKTPLAFIGIKRLFGRWFR